MGAILLSKSLAATARIQGLVFRDRMMILTPEVAMSDRSAGSFRARSGQSRFGRSLTSRCLLFYPFKNSYRTAKHAA